MLQALIGRGPHLFVLEPMPEIEGLKILVLVQVNAVLHRIGGNSGRLEMGGQLGSTTLAKLTRDKLVQRLSMLKTPEHRGEALVANRIAEHSKERAPLAVVGDRHRDPPLVAVLVATAIGAVRRISLRAVALRAEHTAGGEGVNQR